MVSISMFFAPRAKGPVFRYRFQLDFPRGVFVRGEKAVRVAHCVIYLWAAFAVCSEVLEVIA